MISAPLAETGAQRFIALTTFRRNGTGVPTPVWVAVADDGLVVTTPAGSGKLKRLRNNPAVTLAACTRRGKPIADAPTVNGVAEIVADDRQAEAYTKLIAKKYGWEYRLIMTIEKLRGGERKIIRISDA